ncbi:MAG TPA: hypothetical protein VH134_01935 [Candidatus Dormibacteraeota bacterium]|jgi:hypothetical protein|nr:hypothetical protein [Candidatus Dormibacteraeota bacterium]
MHVKLLLTAGAAAASLVAGTAGTVILGHASPAPQHKVTKPAPHHLSNAHHSGTTKGNSGTVTHHHKGTKGNLHSTGNGKPKHSPKPSPKPTPTPTPHP